MKKQDIYDNISDDEIRIVSNSQNQKTLKKKTKLAKNLWWLLGLFAIVILCVILFVTRRSSSAPETYGEAQNPETPQMQMTASVEPVDSAHRYVDAVTDTINDIALLIITPQGGVPRLKVGPLGKDTADLVLCAMAADVREDNGEISGAYVVKGELVSKGLPKLGFCAIIGNQVTIGRQKDTPLFERAIQEEGYFFRHYSLVSDGQMVDIKPKGKALRRALCFKDNRICIVQSVDKESYHDFAQALADLGVTEAISLVGGEASMIYRTEDGKVWHIGLPEIGIWKNVNYIIWSSK